MLTEQEFQLLENYRTSIIAEVNNIGFTGDLQLKMEIAAAKFAHDLLLALSTPTPAPAVPVTPPTPTPIPNVYSA